jgi:predicted  nucleic acid-binding Zn-ribbon protein
MGIQVQCPNGHVFKVKDKYAGKKGLCPKCEGQVVVQVPDELPSKTEKAFRDAVLNEHRASHAAPPVSGNASVFDDHPAEADASTSASLIGSSVIRHKTKCECGAGVPMWYAKCPSCGRYLDHG